jgi:hypothetical protein
MIERLEFTGAGSDVPLDIANNRAMRNPFHPNAPSELRERFAVFLHQQIKEAVDGIPDYKLEWARCSFAGQMRERYMLQRAVFEFLTGWGRTGGGFTVPKGDFSVSCSPVHHSVLFRLQGVRRGLVQEGLCLRGPEYQELERI